MVTLLLIMLCFKIVNLELIVPKEKDDLKQCVHNLIGNISNGYRTVLFYSDNSYDYGFYNSTEISFMNMDARKNIYNYTNYRMGKEVIVLSISRTKQFVKYIKTMYEVGLWSYKSTRIRRFIIILPFKEQWQLRDTLFPYLWELQMVDVVLLYHDEKNIKLYTSDPENPANECGVEAKFMIWYECNQVEKIKFPKFWRNHKNCDLIYWNQQQIQRIQYINEMFFKAFFVLETARQRLNFTIVESKKRNITKVHSLPFVSNGLIWIVPAPNIIHALEVFKIIFKQIVWILILVSFIFVSIVWWSVSKCKQHISFVASLLDIYSATLFGSINRIPPFLSLRLIFTAYVLYTVHIQTAFTSNLIPLLTIPQYDHSITSLKELAQSQLPILTHAKMYLVFNQKEKYDCTYENLKNKVVVVNQSYILDCITNKEILRNSSILITKLDLDIIIKMKGVKSHYIKDEKFLQYLTMSSLVSNPGSYLFTPIKKILSILLESGIMDYQQRNYENQMKNYSSYYADDTKLIDEENVVLTMEHVYPIFVYWGIGLIISIVVFILEILIYRFT
ncbi:hypothetical protein FQA39_LY01905 [Lamprigera yunnana]|nr:hypothetical protein FQA39_LY01905 [Lamprigera yunnana]